MEEVIREVIFSQTFPKVTPKEMLGSAEDLSKGIQSSGGTIIPPFEKVIKRFREEYTYEPRPGAAERSKQFISCAIAICKDFEIDTEIVALEHQILVNMGLYSSWYGGAIKHALVELLRLADDVSFAPTKDEPARLRVSMGYYTHNMFQNGAKVEWR